DEGGLVEHARIGHLEPQVGALTGTLAHSGEHGDTAVLSGDAVDHLLDQDGLAHSGTAEEADLPAFQIGGDQVDDLDARLEDLPLRLHVLESGRLTMDRPAGLTELLVGSVE